MQPLKRILPGPGQESVWDYPRPPRVEPSAEHVQVVFNGTVIADTHAAMRVLETSHAPVYYIPPADIQWASFEPVAGRRSFCEWKGNAIYYDIVAGGARAAGAAWAYPEPTAPFAAIRDYVAVYPGRVDYCLVDGERVQPQPGEFYGGWITRRVVGPFKGGPGTQGW